MNGYYFLNCLFFLGFLCIRGEIGEKVVTERGWYDGYIMFCKL